MQIQFRHKSNLTIGTPNGSQQIGGTAASPTASTEWPIFYTIGLCQMTTEGWKECTSSPTSNRILGLPIYITATGGTITTGGHCTNFQYHFHGTRNFYSLLQCVHLVLQDQMTVSYDVVSAGGGGAGGGKLTGRSRWRRCRWMERRQDSFWFYTAGPGP